MLMPYMHRSSAVTGFEHQGRAVPPPTEHRGCVCRPRPWRLWCSCSLRRFSLTSPHAGRVSAPAALHAAAATFIEAWAPLPTLTTAGLTRSRGVCVPCFAAEEELGRAKVQPQCLQTVLQMLTQEAVDLAVRQAASIFFKNLVKAHWAPEDETAYTIPPETKTQVKDNLLSLFLFVPAKIQSQLSEAMSLIATHDFPAQWPNLLSDLVGQLTAAASATPRDYGKVGGLLAIAHSITGRYRHEFKSDTLYAEIKTVLEAFQTPLLSLAQLAVSELPAATAAGKAAVVPLLTAITTLVKLFYDLTAQDLPEYFEDHLAEWIAIFTTLLRYANPALDCDDDDTEPSPISYMQSEVVECLALLMSKEEEVRAVTPLRLHSTPLHSTPLHSSPLHSTPLRLRLRLDSTRLDSSRLDLIWQAFQPHLSDTLSTVWTLLMATGLAPHMDLLATTAIRFLTTIACSPHHALFASQEVLQNVCEKIIAPNVQLLTQDEELFEDNPFEYIRRDVEGSDADTRRRVSCDLVRGLCRNYEAQLTTLFSGYVASLLAQAAASSANWKAKDAAVYLVIALTLRGSTAKLGATQTNQLVNLNDFFASHVLPELQAGAAGAPAATHHPILLADALKFVTLFGAQLPSETFGAVMPLLAALLTNKLPVVHTYAANAIKQLLTYREAAPPGTNVPPASLPLRFGKAALVPLLQPVLTGLFGALKMAGSVENAYVMRTILKVAVVADDGMVPYVTTVVEELKGHLQRVCENPSNPQFNHYMFEAIAALVRSLCKASPQAVDAFEGMLFPPFQYVLQRDVSEFTPYVFQILAQLLECRSGLSAAYSSLFPPLLLPTMWERPANVPALTRLLTAYIAVGKEAVAPQLEKVLGVFQKLLASKATDSHACLLLGAIWRSFELAELASFINPIFTLCLQRLQSNKKVGASMVRCWSVFVARHGPAAFRAQLESIQPNLFAMLIRGVWADSLNAVSGGVIARKGAAIATARLLTECPELVGDQQTFGVLLQAMLLMLLSDQVHTCHAYTHSCICS